VQMQIATIRGEIGRAGQGRDHSWGGMRPHSQLSKPPRPHHHESTRSPAEAPPRPRAWSTTSLSSPTSGVVVFPSLAEKLRHGRGARDVRPSPSRPQSAPPPPRGPRRYSLRSFPTGRIQGRGEVEAERGRATGAAIAASSGPDPAAGSPQ
jgi:hypothetical protein